MIRKCGVILQCKDKYLLVLGHNSHKWGFPKGRCEYGETPKDTALRELKEETGIQLTHNDMKESREICFHDNMYYHIWISDINQHHIHIEDTNEIQEARWVSLQFMIDLPYALGNYGLNQYKKFINISENNA